jgi:hypothetical protein
MEKITIKIDDSLFEKINDRMAKKGCKTISQCTRELIDLGLKIEEAASLQNDENIEDGIHPFLLDILKTTMVWSLENRFLLRFLAENNTDTDPHQVSEFMKKSKEKAVNYVADFMQNSQKVSIGDN